MIDNEENAADITFPGPTTNWGSVTHISPPKGYEVVGIILNQEAPCYQQGNSFVCEDESKAPDRVTVIMEIKK